MQKQYRLRSTASFSYVYRKGALKKHNLMAIYAVSASNLKVGISVSKKVGNSVVRSKVKRRVKEAFRLLIPRVQAHCNYVINTYPTIAQANYAEIAEALAGLLEKLGKLRAEPTVPEQE